MTRREIVMFLLLMVLLFEADLVILRSPRNRSAFVKMFLMIVLPLVATFAILVVRTWRHFS